MISRLLLNLHNAVSPIVHPEDHTLDDFSEGQPTVFSTVVEERDADSYREMYEMEIGIAI